MGAPSDRRNISAALLALPFAALLALICGAVCIAMAFGGVNGTCTPTGNVKGVPAKLIPIYQQAAARYKLGEKGPAILAGINWEETRFGADLGDSSAGAEGWMQFLPESWAAFGIDGDGDGTRNPNDPWDAIFAAANLLRHSGAPGSWHDAIFSYNHAEWYVEDVLGDAEKWSAIRSVEATATCEVAAPNERVARMVAEAERLSRVRPTSEYVWGGSHGESPTPPNGPFDCSSAVSHLLQVGEFNAPTMDTIALSSWGDPGPGLWVTILVKPYEPEAHTIIKFMPGVTPPDKRYWGTSGFVEPGHGPGWIPESTFDAGYLARFELRHPPGF